MSKTITVTVGERVAAMTLLNTGRFTNSTLAVVLEDIRKFAMNDEDWATANLTKSPTDEEVAALTKEQKAEISQTWKWDETFTKEIEIGKETVDAIVEMIKQKSDAKELTMQDGALLTLEAKLTA